MCCNGNRLIWNYFWFYPQNISAISVAEVDWVNFYKIRKIRILVHWTRGRLYSSYDLYLCPVVQMFVTLHQNELSSSWWTLWTIAFCGQWMPRAHLNDFKLGSSLLVCLSAFQHQRSLRQTLGVDTFQRLIHDEHERVVRSLYGDSGDLLLYACQRPSDEVPW